MFHPSYPKQLVDEKLYKEEEDDLAQMEADIANAKAAIAQKRR